jgi:hypothetical protein
MTQTPSRDWQKDMDTIKREKRTSNEITKMNALNIAEHWLQEAKTLQDKLREMAELIEYEADLADLRGAELHARDLRAMVATLYPDTPAPKEGNNEDL